jgi:hypothetical protein
MEMDAELAGEADQDSLDALGLGAMGPEADAAASVPTAVPAVPSYMMARQPASAEQLPMAEALPVPAAQQF